MNDKVKEKIAELVPDVIDNAHAQLIGWDNKVTYFTSYKPFTLAVVLRAIKAEKPYSYFIDIEGSFWKWDKLYKTPEQVEGAVKWNLEHDNYDQQSEETRAFIGLLLG